jgi:molecular chaperone DnaJ
MRDLYSVLGVSKDADPAAIKKAYKKLAREFHPDRNPEEAATERFKAITSAYEVIGDEECRALYDEFGEASLQQGFDPDLARRYGTRGSPGRGGMDPGDMFSSLFGQGRRNANFYGRARRGPNLRSRLDLDLWTAIQGGRVPLSLRKPSSCAICAGQGGTGKATCGTCQGSGRVRANRWGLDAMVGCDTCGGDGHVFATECGACAGTGRGFERMQLTVNVPPGIEDGQTLRLKGQGGAGRDGGAAGDLHVTLKLAPHARLRRDGDDLELELPLTVAEAALGAKVKVPTPWAEVLVRVPAGAGNGARLRIRGHGVRRGEDHGDLYLVLRPEVPRSDDPRLAELAEALGELYESHPRADFSLP